jgi:hypothetical protein
MPTSGESPARGFGDFALSCELVYGLIRFVLALKELWKLPQGSVGGAHPAKSEQITRAKPI